MTAFVRIVRRLFGRGTWTCDRCGAVNHDPHVTCWKCGS